MKFALIGAVLITLPAICAFVYGLIIGNQYIWLAALASLGINSLPFLAAGLLMRRADGDDLGH